MHSLSELENISVIKYFNKKYLLITIPTILSKTTMDISRSDFSIENVEEGALDYHLKYTLPSVFKKKYNIYCFEVDSKYRFLVTTKQELDLERIYKLLDILDHNTNIRFDFTNITDVYKCQSRNKKFPTLETIKRDNKNYEREKIYKAIKDKEIKIKAVKQTLEKDEKELKHLISKLTPEEKLLYEIGELGC